MSRVRNADKFRERLRLAGDNYLRAFEPYIREQRRKYAENPDMVAPVEVAIEAHNRAYMINQLLGSLNWRLDARPEDDLPPLIPEAPVRSAETRNIRFLDYFSFERKTATPLLVVEAKHRSYSLPTVKTMTAMSMPEAQRVYAEAIAQGLRGNAIDKNWSGWLRDLKDYTCSIHEASGVPPRRVVLTNGKWLVLFLDPKDAFLNGGSRDPGKILVFRDWKDIDERCPELFMLLEHQAVLGEAPSLAPGDLPFYISHGPDLEVMHGLRLRYFRQPTFYQGLSPLIRVAPVIFIGSRYGSWLRTETFSQEYTIPHRLDELSEHLQEVHRAAETLLDDVNQRLGTSLKPIPLTTHYENEEGFEVLRGVIECREDEFLVVTGDHTHYLLSEPTECTYHDWANCRRAGVPSNPGPLTIPSVEERSYFISGEIYHCAHRDVVRAKSAVITDDNRLQCGSRSGANGQAFCKIFRFESHLCCQACAFRDVCTNTNVFRLPC